MTLTLKTKIAAAAFAGFAGAATMAAADEGPVATPCKADTATFCADKPHGSGQVRACLDANKDKVSAACKAALEGHAPGGGQKKDKPE